MELANNLFSCFRKKIDTKIEEQDEDEKETKTEKPAEIKKPEEPKKIDHKPASIVKTVKVHK